MRIGIFGGSFDPVHLGHLLLAESAREQAALDQVWFVPVAQQPLKLDRQLTPGTERMRMLELALGGNEAFQLSTVELDRGGVSYTVDTLAALTTQSPGNEWFFLVGADSLREFHHWREPARICELATLAIACRPHSPEPDLVEVAQRIGLAPAQSIRHVRIDMPQVDISSSDLRARLTAGRSIRYRVPRAVEKWIETQQLYR